MVFERNNLNNGNPSESSLGGLSFKASADWQSPFGCELKKYQIPLGTLATLEVSIPATWEQVPLRGRTVWAPKESNACLIIGFGKIPSGGSIKSIAESPASQMKKSGAIIPVVMTIPVIRSSAPTKGHMCNFPASIPKSLVAEEPGNQMTQYFKYSTVVELPNGNWFSVETASWGDGCNPAVEMRSVAEIHSGFRVL